MGRWFNRSEKRFEQPERIPVKEFEMIGRKSQPYHDEAHILRAADANPLPRYRRAWPGCGIC